MLMKSTKKFLTKTLAASCLALSLCGVATEKASAQTAGVNFDGNNFINAGTIVAGGSSYTKEAWIKPNASTTHNILSGGDDPFWLYGGHLRAAHHWSQGLPTDVIDTATIPLGVWTHVAVTYDAPTGVIKLYRNGQLTMQSNTISTYETSYQQVGAFNDGNRFDGDMDEIRMWNRALCQPELNLHMNTELLGTENGLMLYYKFNEGTPFSDNSAITTVSDASGQNNIGALVGFTLTGNTGNFVTGRTAGNYSAFIPPFASITKNINGNTVTLTANTASAYQWMLSGAEIAGANSQNYVALPGVYTVRITASNGCMNTSEPMTVTPADTQVQIITKFKVTPNPTVAGQDSFTIYRGYSTQTVSISALASAGTAPYSYTWSNGKTGSLISVSPKTTTTYTVNITDAAGRTATKSITIYVIDIRCTAKKVLVCHKETSCGGGVTYNTLCISVNAVPAHLCHGDKLGSCNTAREESNMTAIQEDVQPIVYPNPTKGLFTISLPLAAETRVVVVDMAGKVVTSVTNSGESKQVQIDLSNAPAGMYYINMKNGDNTYQQKLVKE